MKGDRLGPEKGKNEKGARRSCEANTNFGFFYGDSFALWHSHGNAGPEGLYQAAIERQDQLQGVTHYSPDDDTVSNSEGFQ